MEQATDITGEEYVEVDLFVRFPDGRVISFELPKVRNVKAEAIIQRAEEHAVFSDDGFEPIAKFYGADRITGTRISLEALTDESSMTIGRIAEEYRP